MPRKKLFSNITFVKCVIKDKIRIHVIYMLIIFTKLLKREFQTDERGKKEGLDLGRIAVLFVAIFTRYALKLLIVCNVS